MATVKSAGSTRLGRDSVSKRLGVKMFGGEIANPGNILIRQRGSRFLAGKGVKKGADDTLYSKIKGVVKFSSKNLKRFNGKSRKVKVISVEETK
ncbi:50S ribosomal protein L27 [Candidatus Azambacteria bacterium]|nr:50S ribosomal protein L27 [Candidatus Azambacteria bacterium]